MANPFVHLELNTPNLAAASRVLLASSSTGPLQTTIWVTAWFTAPLPLKAGLVAAYFPYLMLLSIGSPYVGVEDVNIATEKATSLGAKLIRGPHEVPGIAGGSAFL